MLTTRQIRKGYNDAINCVMDAIRTRQDDREKSIRIFAYLANEADALPRKSVAAEIAAHRISTATETEFQQITR